MAIKNVGAGAINSIVEAREQYGNFKSIYEFCERVNLRLTNKRVLESLIKAGAFDSLGFKRAQLTTVIDKATAVGQQMQKDREKGQQTFLEELEEEKSFSSEFESLPDIEEWPDNEKLQHEKEMIGIYLSGHPLADYSETIKVYSSANTQKMKKLNDGDEIRIGGMIINLSTKITRKGDHMAIFLLEDLEGMVEAIVFPSNFAKLRGLLSSHALIYIIGRVDLRDQNKTKIVVENIIPLEQIQKRIASSLHIELREVGLEDELLHKLKDLLSANQGKCKVYFRVINSTHPKHTPDTIIISDVKVKAETELIKQIESILGEHCASFRPE
jgi:DNA polymerase-3 subunit alpha